MGKEEPVDVTIVMAKGERLSLCQCRVARLLQQQSGPGEDRLQMRAWEVTPALTSALNPALNPRVPPHRQLVAELAPLLFDKVFIIFEGFEDSEWTRGHVTEDSSEGKALLVAFALTRAA